MAAKDGPKLDEAKGGDRRGPIAVGVAASQAVKAAEPAKPGEAKPAEAKPPETRVVVMGDSDFASNVAINISGNRDFFMNIVGWLSQQENLIAIRPKEAGDSRLTLTNDQARRITWLALFLLPGRHPGDGRLHLVAEAVMRGFRSTFVLLLVLLGLVGYIYFYEMKRPATSETAEQKQKVFTVEADKIAEVDVKSASGDRTVLKKTGDAWRIVQPIDVKADETRGHGDRHQPGHRSRSSASSTRRPPTSRSSAWPRRASRWRSRRPARRRRRASCSATRTRRAVKSTPSCRAARACSWCRRSSSRRSTRARSTCATRQSWRSIARRSDTLEIVDQGPAPRVREGR